MAAGSGGSAACCAAAELAAKAHSRGAKTDEVNLLFMLKAFRIKGNIRRVRLHLE
jgi:hypothetical protein